MPSAKAADLTPQQKAQTLTNEILGLDTTKYDVRVENYENGAEMDYLGVVPQYIVTQTLTSDQDNIELFYTFANNNLQMLTIYKDRYAPEGSNYFRDVAVARDFLAKYQNYAGNSLYTQLSSIIPIEGVSGNYTVISENVVLEAIITEDTTAFKWYYTANGAVAPYSKFVTLIVEKGCLSAFVDNWHLYPVGNTRVGLSRDEALSVALEAARGHVWSLGVEASSLSVENFNENNVCWEALVFMSSVDADNARSEYPLVLYPVWQFGIALDRWYGYMYGVQMDIWADTGEVRRVHEAWSTILPEEEEAFLAGLEAQDSVGFEAGLSLTVLTVFSACVVMVAGFAIVCMGGVKKLHYAGLFKRHGFKVSGVLLCIALASTMFLGALETVNASRGAVVWGSESTGAINSNGSNWRKSTTEINLQRDAGGYIGGFFLSGGYTGIGGINRQGAGSTATSIKSTLGSLYNNRDAVAVVDFNHGVGRHDHYSGLNEFHYMFEDQVGTKTTTGDNKDNAVYDCEIYNLATQGKTAFVLINTCLSADRSYGEGYLSPQGSYPGRIVSMPYAWTGRLVSDRHMSGFTVSQHISNDAYAKPDWGNQVFMGFTGGAASLQQSVPTSGGNPYYYWVGSFMGNALTIDQSVNQALNAASLQFLGTNFAASPLRQGFMPYWWNFSGSWPSSTLAVFGNGNIHLKNYVASHVVSAPSVGGSVSGDIGATITLSANSVDSQGHKIRYIVDWADGTSTTTGYFAENTNVALSHSWSVRGIYGVKVYAQCEHGCSSGWSGVHSVAVGDFPWLTVDAWDDYGNEWNVGVYLNNQFVGYTPLSLRVADGWHSVSVDWQAYIFVIFDSFSDGSNNGDPRFISSDTMLTANYRHY